MMTLFSCDSKEDKKGRYLLKGNEKFKINDLKSAIDFYTEAIKIDEEFRDARYNRALCFEKLRKYDLAIEDYTKILDFSPADSSVLFLRGMAYLDNGENYKALNDAASLIQTSNLNWQGYFLQGLGHERLKDFNLAIESFKSGLNINSKNADLLANIGTIYYYQKNYDKAEEYLSSAENLNPKEANIFNVKSLIAFENKRFDSALELVNKAIELDPENPFSYNNKGLYLIYLNQLDKAIENINYSIKLYPKNDYALRNKGIYYYYEGDFISAKKYLEDLLNKVPNMELVQEYYEKVKEKN